MYILLEVIWKASISPQIPQTKKERFKKVKSPKENDRISINGFINFKALKDVFI